MEALDVLEQLVAIPSVNPMGRSVSGPPYGEARLTDFLEKTLRSMGLATERQAAEPGRDNLIARLDGNAGGPVVLLDAHQDTVPVDGMTVEPFRPVRRDGRLYGRGACDTKGGMAAMLAAVSRLADQRLADMPTVVVSCTVNEEYGFTGAARLTALWTSGQSKLLARRPDAAIVAEPTGLDVVTVHKGVVRWRCHARGRAAHGSQPEAGDSAIYKMARALAAIERYAKDLARSGASHPLCGPATVNVGTIQGGLSVNTVPDRCTIEIDRRLPPGESPETARRQLVEHLAQGAGLDFALDHDPSYMQGPALSDQGNGRLADRLAAVATEVAGGCRKVGVPYATNAAFYAAAGVPTVVFGPGWLAQAHAADEWLPLDQLRHATEIVYRFCRSWAA